MGNAGLIALGRYIRKERRRGKSLLWQAMALPFRGKIVVINCDLADGWRKVALKAGGCIDQHVE